MIVRVGVCLAFSLGCGVLSLPCGAQVFVRGQRDALPGIVQSVGIEGVRVDQARGVGTSAALIGLENVRDVQGEQAQLFAPLASLAEAAWRGRARVERGDFAGAEPVLEGIEPRVRGVVGPTGSAVYAGLVRCRLARSARGGAIIAWLRLLECRGSAQDREQWTGAWQRDADLIDGSTALAIGLPPIFGGAALPDVTGSAWDELAVSPDPKVSELAVLYRAAWLFESQQRALVSAVAEAVSSDDGVRLVRDIVLSRIGESEQRQASRERLVKRLQTADIEPWQEAWCRTAIGRSLMGESDPDARRAGVLQALHVPAGLARHAPELAALVLAESAITLAELGDQVGAAALKDELSRVAPSHRLLELPSLRAIRPALAPGGQNKAVTP